MLDVMLDIETLDNIPSAVVLSFAAVVFDSTTYETKGSFYRVLDFSTQLQRGRTVSQDTFLWWMDQSDEARKAAFAKERMHVGEALMEFGNYIQNIGTDFGYVWANSPTFDCIIMASLHRTYGLPLPWTYSQELDVRTMRRKVQIDKTWNPIEPIPGVPHHPTYDCLWQIALLKECDARILVS